MNNIKRYHDIVSERLDEIASNIQIKHTLMSRNYCVIIVSSDEDSFSKEFYFPNKRDSLHNLEALIASTVRKQIGKLYDLVAEQLNIPYSMELMIDIKTDLKNLLFDRLKDRIDNVLNNMYYVDYELTMENVIKDAKEHFLYSDDDVFNEAAEMAMKYTRVKMIGK